MRGTSAVLFTEFRFLVFFALVFGVYWCLRYNRHRKWLLLLSSYLFYGAWDWRFLGLIIGSTLVDWLIGLRLGQEGTDRSRRTWIALSVVWNLGILAFFKYANFFIDSGVCHSRCR